MQNANKNKCGVNIQVLQAHSGQLISNQLFEEMKKLHMSSHPRTQNAGPMGTPVTEGISEDIEAEVNNCFHQMFSGQLTIDAMIQMLARFKESSEKRSVKFICIFSTKCYTELLISCLNSSS